MHKWKIFEWEMFDEATNERSLGQRRRRDDGDKIAMLTDYRCRTYISIKYTDRVEDDVLMLRACVIVCNFLKTHTHIYWFRVMLILAHITSLQKLPP